MSGGPVSSLSAALLVTKGNAQPSRGLAQPISERIVFPMREPVPRETQIARASEPVVPVTWPAAAAFAPPPPPPSTATSRITLRVDDNQRLRLRLASAHLGKSRQVILIDALDHYLKRVMPSFLHEPCPCIQGESVSGADCCQRTEHQ
jgi:hypothetical protein